MRLRRDTRGEIGVFEDLQSLIVVVVAIAVLLGSVMYNWSSLSATEQDQDLHDEAEHIIRQIEASDRIRAIDNLGSPYDEPLLSQHDLRVMVEDGGFEDEVRSDYHYNVTFEDLVQEEEINFTHAQGAVRNETWMLEYSFGEPVPEGKGTVSIEVHYTLVMHTMTSRDVSLRHPCLVTVVVWR
jgi:hypothetical protein